MIRRPVAMPTQRGYAMHRVPFPYSSFMDRRPPKPPLVPHGLVAEPRHGPDHDSLPRLAHGREERSRKTEKPWVTSILRAIWGGILPLLLGLLSGKAAWAADDASRALERARFKQAETALRQNHWKTYRKLKATLTAYPLYPYLDYAELRKKLATLTPARLDRFEKRHADTPLPRMLHSQWLGYKARHQQWYDFLKGYRDNGRITRQCHYLNALIHTGRRGLAHRKVRKVWLHGHSRPKACDPVFADWIEHGRLSRKLLLERVGLAMKAGDTRLVRALRKRMKKGDKRFVQAWLKLMKQPDKLLDPAHRLPHHPLRAIAHETALARLIRADSATVLAQWRPLAAALGLENKARRRLAWRLGFRLFDQGHRREALKWLDRIEARADETKQQERRLRLAIQERDWSRLLRWAEALPRATRNSERWRYWRARALEASGRKRAAKRLYAQVARERGYYGFLAADHIGAAYNLKHKAVSVETRLLARIERAPVIARMRELFALHRPSAARREWRHFTEHMTNEELRAAAKTAQRHGWLDRAIFTLARTGYWDDLVLRFPLAHRDIIRAATRRHSLDDAWVFAIMRQESAFMHDARSRTGATGLMQLMPKTARHIARDLSRKRPRRADLLRPETNIALGAGYLNQVKRQLGDSLVLATAAYNAGPHRVKRWLPEQATEADIWVESIPFRETRRYVQRVMSYLILYEKRLGRTHSTISKRMGTILPRIDGSRDKIAGKG